MDRPNERTGRGWIVRGRICLTAGPHSAHAARRFLADSLTVWGLTALVDDGTLLISELVTNAAAYDGPIIDVEAEATGGRLRVTVHDGGTTDIVAPPGVPPEAEGGRGLFLVQQISSQWGVEHEPGGKQVWFELTCPPGLPTSRQPVGSAPLR